MKKSEYEVFKTNDWYGCLEILNKYWNKDYGDIRFFRYAVSKKEVVELITGGKSENEKLVDKIAGTLFWVLWWQESKRGGYYKFVNSYIKEEN